MIHSLFLALIAHSSTANFPEVYTPETGLPAWQKVRVEGQEKSYVWKHILGYAQKASRKKFTAPQEAYAYFGEQIALQRYLRQMPPPANAQTASLAMVGDIMWIQNGWDRFLSPSVLAELNRHDFAFGNLETVISKSHSVPHIIPVRSTFNSKPELVTAFRRANGASTFSALSIANNHALDYKDLGLKETMEFLQQQKIPFSGAQPLPKQKKYVVVEHAGFRIGFYAATYGMNGKAERNSKLPLNLLPGVAPLSTAPVDISSIREVLEQMAAEKVDLKIVSLHWGFEYEYYPEPKNMLVAREIIRAGADIIMGHHPHAQQPSEVCLVNGYEDRLPERFAEKSGCVLEDSTGRPRKALITYSLGNFITNMYGALSELGMIQSLVLSKDAAGEVDWHQPRYKLVYNSKWDSVHRARRTYLADEYFAANCWRKSGCKRSQKDGVRFLRNHLMRD